MTNQDARTSEQFFHGGAVLGKNADGMPLGERACSHTWADVTCALATWLSLLANTARCMRCQERGVEEILPGTLRTRCKQSTWTNASNPHCCEGWRKPHLSGQYEYESVSGSGGPDDGALEGDATSEHFSMPREATTHAP
jgi:hypothetical protein